VSGEITLHSEYLYVEISQSILATPSYAPLVLYRSCAGRADYSGGHNHFCGVMELKTPSILANMLKFANSKRAATHIMG